MLNLRNITRSSHTLVPVATKIAAHHLADVGITELRQELPGSMAYDKVYYMCVCVLIVSLDYTVSRGVVLDVEYAGSMPCMGLLTTPLRVSRPD